MGLCGITQCQGNIHLLFQTVCKRLYKQGHDLLHMVLIQRMEYDDLINPVQKFRAEDQLHLIHDILFHPLVIALFVLLHGKSKLLGINDRLGPCIGGHDNDRVAEIHLSSLGIGDMSVIQNLQKNIEYVRMRLLHLVKQHDRIGMRADPVAELTAVPMAHISRRRADHLGHRMLFHIFGHVYPDDGFLIAEQSLRKGLGQFGLSYPCRSQEQEGANGPSGILQSRPAALYSPCHRADRFLLSDDPLVKLFFQLVQPLAVAFLQLLHRDLRPCGHHLGDILLRDYRMLGLIFFIKTLPHSFDLFLNRLLFFLNQMRLCEIPCHNACFLLADQLLLGILQPGKVLRNLVSLQADPGACLIQHVNSLVGKIAVCDIALRHVYGCLHGICSYGNPVVGFVFFLQSFQDLQAVRLRRLFHIYRLETPFQSRVLFNIFPIFRQGGGPDHLQLPSCQRRFEDVGGIHGALRAACADQGVKLIHKQDHVGI